MLKILVAGFLLLGGAGTIAFSVHRWRQWRRVRDWQPVRGEVVEARVKEVWDYSHAMKSRAPEVIYRYACQAGSLTGRQITVHDRHLESIDPADVQAVLDRIDPHPLVYVDPADPANAVLVNRLERPHFDYLLTRLGIGVLLVVASVVVMTVVPSTPG